MNEQLRDRFLLPLVLPGGIIALALLIIFLLSRILLALPTEIATTVALLGALGILGVAALLATQRHLEKWQVYSAIMIPALALIIGGLFAAAHLQEEEAGHAEEPAVSAERPGEGAATATPAAGGGGVQAATSWTVDAGDNFFDKTELTVPAGQEFTIVMNNIGRAIHNIHIYDRQGGTSIAATDPLAIPGGQSGTLKAKIDQPGSYFFQCDFHPVEMTGTLNVQGERAGAEATPRGPAAGTATPASGGGSGAPASTSIQIEARDNSFDKTELTVPAGQQFTITMTNAGRAIHNVNVYDRQGGRSIAATDPMVIPGGQSGTLRTTIERPGEYFFQCDFHPVEMIGKLIVR